MVVDVEACLIQLLTMKLIIVVLHQEQLVVEGGGYTKLIPLGCLVKNSQTKNQGRQDLGMSPYHLLAEGVVDIKLNPHG
jgi:hypothetical protein